MDARWALSSSAPEVVHRRRLQLRCAKGPVEGARIQLVFIGDTGRRTLSTPRTKYEVPR
jgi:hypothetical protein